MPWQCRMREPPTTEERWGGDVQIGEMWYAPWLLTEDGQPAAPDYLSTTYVEQRMGCRPPLMVRLPGGIDFCIDSRADSPGGERGWHIEGKPPNLTLSPSINVLGVYHGFIRGGVITDDLSRKGLGGGPHD